MRTLRNLSMALLAITVLATNSAASYIAECDRVGTDFGWHPSYESALEACQEMFGENPAGYCDWACSANSGSGESCSSRIYSQQEVVDCHIEPMPLEIYIFGAHCACATDEYYQYPGLGQ